MNWYRGLKLDMFKKEHSQNGKSLTVSVTRLGELLDFGHVFKAFGNN